MTTGTKIAEWWPSSAKLVLNKDWDNGIHTHDVDQLINELARWFYGTTGPIDCERDDTPASDD